MRTRISKNPLYTLALTAAALLISQAIHADPSNMASMVVQGYLKRSGTALNKSSVAASVCFTNSANSGALLSGNTNFDTSTCIGGAAASGGTINIVNGVFSFIVSSPTAAQIAASGSGGALGAKVRLVIDSVPEYVSVTVSAAPLATYATLSGGVGTSGISTAMIAANAVDDTKLASTGTLPSGWTVATSSLSGTIPTSSLTGTLASGSFPATLPAVSGANLTNVTADNLAGTLPTAVFPATLPAVSGANLTNLSASNISGGTLSASYLPTTLNATTFAGNITMPATASSITQGASASGALTVATTNTQNLVLAPDTTGVVQVTGTTPTVSGASTLTLGSTSNGNINVSPNGTGAVVIGGTNPTLTTASNANLSISPNGTGVINAPGLPSRARIDLFEDFYSGLNAYAAASTSAVGTALFSTGTAAAAGSLATGPNTGVFRMAAATTVSVSSVLGFCSGNGTNGQVRATGSFAAADSWTFETKLTISATSANQMILMGLIPTGAITYQAAAASMAAVGSYFYVLPGSTTVTPVNRNAATTTGTNSSFVAATAARWTISYDGAGNTSFYKDGALIGSALTANTPSASAVCPAIVIVTTGTAATARNIDVDYISYTQNLATPR